MRRQVLSSSITTTSSGGTADEDRVKYMTSHCCAWLLIHKTSARVVKGHIWYMCRNCLAVVAAWVKLDCRGLVPTRRGSLVELDEI